MSAHGTTSGYHRHRGRGEKPCDPCREAWNAYLRERRKTNPPTDAQRAAQAVRIARWEAANPDASRQNYLRQKARERAMRRLAKEYGQRFDELLAEELGS